MRKTYFRTYFDLFREFARNLLLSYFSATLFFRGFLALWLTLSTLNAKTTIHGATPGAIPRIDWNLHEGSFFQERKKGSLQKGSIFANQAAWERGSKIGNARKWLREGAKGLLDPGSKSFPRVSCTFRNLFCTGATPFCTSARGFSLPGSKRPFAPPLQTTFGNFLFSTPSPRRLGLQVYFLIGSLASLASLEGMVLERQKWAPERGHKLPCLCSSLYGQVVQQVVRRCI